MYKIMIVDDEEEIRLGIIKRMDWESFGFVVVGDAENGEEALEKAEKLEPDVIMTDIRMPFMDGLELGNKISQILPSTKIIVFSGYDDFEYAKQAIKINVIEYLLKPINSAQLAEVLKNLKMKLDKEYDEKRNIDILKQHYLESLPVMREQFFIGAIEGRVKSDSWKSEIKNLCVEFQGEYFAVGLIKLEDIDRSDEEFIKENSLLLISIKKIVDENMSKFCNFVSFLYVDKVVVIGNFKDKSDINREINGLNEVCKIFYRIMNRNIAAGIGDIVEEASKLYLSYKTAEDALEYRVVLGGGRAIYINDVEHTTSIRLQLDENKERELLNAVKVSSVEEIRNVIGELFKDIESAVLPFNQYRIYFMEIMTSLLKLVQIYNLDIDEIFGEGVNFYKYLEKLNSIEKIKEWFIEKATAINSGIKKNRMRSSAVIVESAKEYIRKNYMDHDISVEKLCDSIHVSPTYFSTIFKKETDMNFVSFLTEVRLEEAIKLLNTTVDKTYVIANKIGYEEANYFSYVFKKKFGVSPSKYRKN
ncbi:MAG: response regulator [Clostridium sp.]|uniref:response regulator n=1 Tax=Clostridium sp. TaxID=1506 RepID=UPI002A8993A3|nr:response regulator [Clostridium sp.]MDY5096968.1 response regulator [Clostridium sp.]